MIENVCRWFIHFVKFQTCFRLYRAQRSLFLAPSDATIQSGIYQASLNLCYIIDISRITWRHSVGQTRIELLILEKVLHLQENCLKIAFNIKTIRRKKRVISSQYGNIIKIAYVHYQANAYFKNVNNNNLYNFNWF